MRPVLRFVPGPFLTSLLCAAGGHPLAAAPEGEIAAPAFRLLKWRSTESVSLKDLAGQVVVLDFFANWCVPCVRATTELETGLQQFYHARKGNPQRIPVRVISVNIEQERPSRTDAFIKGTGASLVLDDPGGTFFEQCGGGGGLPFVVIVDATRLGGDSPQGRIVYRRVGYEGLGRLREVIDAIGRGGGSESSAQPVQEAKAAQPTPSPTDDAEATSAGLTPTVATPPASIAQVNLDFAGLWTDGVRLTDALIEFPHRGVSSDLVLGFSYGHIGLRYEPTKPIDLFGETNSVAEDRFGAQGRLRQKLGTTVTLLGSGGGYKGFMDYRSAWIAEYYRQRFGGFSAYEEPNPWGYNVSGGLRWEYLPASGFVQGDFVYQQDTIAPSWEKIPFQPLQKGREVLDTYSGRLTLENVFTRRIRTLLEFQVTDTTDRELRYSLQGSANYALAQHWVCRLLLLGTLEAPDFRSGAVGGALERDWNETWFVSLMARYYEDNGEFEESLVYSSAAPALEALQVGVGLRWQSRKWSAKVVVGPYFSDYAPVEPGTIEFSRLYVDRTWFSAQAALSHEF